MKKVLEKDVKLVSLREEQAKYKPTMTLKDVREEIKMTNPNYGKLTLDDINQLIAEARASAR